MGKDHQCSVCCTLHRSGIGLAAGQVSPCAGCVVKTGVCQALPALNAEAQLRPRLRDEAHFFSRGQQIGNMASLGGNLLVVCIDHVVRHQHIQFQIAAAGNPDSLGGRGGSCVGVGNGPCGDGDDHVIFQHFRGGIGRNLHAVTVARRIEVQIHCIVGKFFFCNLAGGPRRQGPHTEIRNKVLTSIPVVHGGNVAEEQNTPP